MGEWIGGASRQSRVTVIASSRDDNFRRQYESQHDPALTRSIRELFGRLRLRRRFGDVPQPATTSLDEALRTLVALIAPETGGTVIQVDLTNPELGVPVVKVIAPGLEFFSLFVGYSPGRRARLSTERGGLA
ncbi:MAG: YcaO-like family protein [Pseudonocardiaceae bacterium]